MHFQKLKKLTLFNTTVLISGLVLTMTGCQVTPPSYKNSQNAAQARTALAAEYIRKGDLDSAKRHLTLGLKDNPRSSEANMMMAVLLQQEGSDINIKEAEKYYKKALEYDRQNAQARNNYGVYLTQEKRYVEAVKELEIAGAALGYSGRSSALENLGRASVLAGKTEKAKKAFMQALNVDYGSLIARIELAELFFNEGQLPEATEMYNQYVTKLGQQSQGARSLYLGILISRAQQDPTRAEKLAYELQQRFPTSPEFTRYKSGVRN